MNGTSPLEPLSSPAPGRPACFRAAAVLALGAASLGVVPVATGRADDADQRALVELLESLTGEDADELTADARSAPVENP
jgi:hypothetical protein